MSDEKFLLEIEEFSKKLKEDDYAESQDFREEDLELEIDHLRQKLMILKKELDTDKKKVHRLNDIIINKKTIFLNPQKKTRYKEIKLIKE